MSISIKAEVKAEVKAVIKAEVKAETVIKAEVKAETVIKAEVKAEAEIKAEVKAEAVIKVEAVVYQCGEIINTNSANPIVFNDDTIFFQNGVQIYITPELLDINMNTLFRHHIQIFNCAKKRINKYMLSKIEFLNTKPELNEDRQKINKYMITFLNSYYHMLDCFSSDVSTKSNSIDLWIQTRTPTIDDHTDVEYKETMRKCTHIQTQVSLLQMDDKYRPYYIYNYISIKYKKLAFLSRKSLETFNTIEINNIITAIAKELLWVGIKPAKSEYYYAK